MFQNACRALLNTLMPIVVGWRVTDGTVHCSIGAGMILSDEGHFLTAGHMLKKVLQLDRQVSGAELAPGEPGAQATHYTAMCGTTTARLSAVLVQEEVDLGVAQLEGYALPDDYVFPRLRARDVELGELLCRVGYPFVDGFQPQWIEGAGFTFTNLFPVPVFANEALVSRFMKLNTGSWIETSSPGLRGQSGGPLVDPDGLICGIQVNTVHYALGFQGAGKNQVLNVGRAVHVATMRSFLDEHGIKYTTEDTEDD